MKRFHVHVAVPDLTQSIEFYSKLFGQAPAVEQPDYAKWMLEDPRVNFAISARGHSVGVNHFGFQADTPEELEALKRLADAASDGEVLDEGEAACCYSKSEKHWTIDPQGLAWEHFRTMSQALEFGSDTAGQNGACCIPLKQTAEDRERQDAACCVPSSSASKSPCQGC